MHLPLPRALALLAALAAAVPPPARAAAPAVPEPLALPPRLTLEEASRLFRERGLDLLLADAAVASAEGDLSAAGAVANPQLSASYGRSRTFGDCVDVQGNPSACGWLPQPQYGLGLSDSGAVFDVLTGKRGLRVDAARAALQAARASRADAERTVGAQVRQQVAQVVLAQESSRFAREVAAAQASALELTRTREAAGAISEADVARVEVAKLEADQAVDAAAQALRDARAQLAFLLGARGEVPEFEVDAPDLAQGREPPALAGATAPALLARAAERRPDLHAARLQRERAEAALALARRQRIPDVTLSLNYAQQGTTNQAVTPPTFTLGLALPLPLFYQQQGEIRRAEADVSTQALQATKLEAQVAADVATGLADYAASGALVRRMEGGLLARAARARDLVQVQYQKGAASLLDYLDAQRTFVATRVEYHQDLAAYWTAVFKLEAAVGEELR
ncbi:TolC family protein [Anaeromyxobacter diazotrophicus]|uniref:TolC family protein n=1 Tax=Anaeromyxobacter diazotrophicus TaxID=2590199 RepID=UPI00159128C0|nr:TolC family protein [Anaeromyxobacter diazotrophicus]